ncbi:glycosyltransferase family 4 protein [Pseudopelagicola sp. nBUS_20]|uniref:glycosyltransferase family 4 protein n=1 Tax=Pseudopelagicola sp. nBUS_20 TaxID=3395317 RepID=UPI003EBBBB45
MKVLFIHQNFPGQFKHLAPALVKKGHEVVSLTLKVKDPTNWNGVRVLPYSVQGRAAKGLHPWLIDFETKLLRGESCYLAARKLREQGFMPDIIVAHPGWGESMFLRDLWPEARIGLYYELYYSNKGRDVGFDPEFPQAEADTASIRLRLKNINNMMHLHVGDMGICPTEFQAASFPKEYRRIIEVVHDGIDTRIVCPNSKARLELEEGITLTRKDEVITFVNRNLEPYRGYHIFMRALRKILEERPNARVLIVGGDEVSYGSQPPKGMTWKQLYIDEVRGQIATPNWDRVHFLGRIPYDQFLSLLQVSKAHVYLTYPFVLSWSLIEAMAAGAPIVASDTAPVQEVIRHGETGQLFPFFDPDRLVKEVCSVLECAELQTELGSAARKFAVANYDLETCCLPRQLNWIDRLFKMTPGAVRT